MSASISLRQKSVAGDFLRRTAGIISGATGEYFKEAMPVTSSIATDAAASAASLSSTLKNTTQSVMPKIRQLKSQTNIRNIMRWYMNSENDLGGNNSFDTDFDFDIETDDNSAAIAEAQMSESSKNAKEIALSVVESSHHMVEAQIANTGNIISSIDKQTAVITTGFDSVNATLNKILEVVTKNTATMIETTVAAANSREDAKNNILNGKFNLNDYKKIISDNAKNSPMGMMAAMIPMIANPGMLKSMMTPEAIAQMLIGGAINKKAPNFKKNLEALDEAVNETIIDSLIRLGSNKSYGKAGQLARIFGINADRKETDTNRSKLELKTVPFDSIAHESITNAIPGYLRKILVQLGGEDVVYDYRSRSFKSKGKIKQEFVNQGAVRGNLGNANTKVQNAIGRDGFGNMVYDLMMTDIGTKGMNANGRKLMDSFADPKKFEEYVRNTLLKGMNLSQNELKRIAQMGQNFGQAARNNDNLGQAVSNQAARNNVNRNKRMATYARNADAYNIDLSEIRDTVEDEIRTIAESYGKKINTGQSSIGSFNKPLEGINYTNAALYEIFRRLDKGINVYQVGSSNERSKPFGSMKGNLPKPKRYSPKTITDPNVAMQGFTSALNTSALSDDPNLLQNQQLEDGSMEDLSRGERFKRWGKQRGGNLAHAMFSGNPEQVKEAFGLIIKDVTQVAGDQVKKGAAHINNQFGNVSGYLKHKLFGTEYTFQDGTDENGNPIYKKVSKNEKGGIFGFVGDYVKDMFKGTKEKGQQWFKTVAGYFDYGDNGQSKEDKGVAKKRNKLIASSVGAFAGAGLLGGPIGAIMGAVAGNALSGLDIGGKIKDLFFGRETEGKNAGKAKGIFTKLGDAIVDPIKYQIGKTANHLGNVLKKNIIGPLADIGGALRDRITSSAESHFGKVFGTIAKLILSPFKTIGKGILNISKFPINLAGGVVRGGMSMVGGATGSILNSIANSIAGKSEHTEIDPETGEVTTTSTKKWLKQRRKDRKEDVKNNKYSSYKDWKAAENERRAERFKKFKGYTEEEVTQITAEEAQKTSENTAQISEDVGTLARLGSEEGSIFTHDKGIHDRLDEILDFFRGMKKKHDEDIIDGEFREIGGAELNGIPKKNLLALPGPTSGNTSDSGDDTANSAIVAAAVLASSGDDVNTDEARLSGDIVDEAGRNKSNKRKILPKLKELFGIQKAKKETEEGDKKESIFSKILKAVGSGLGKIGDILGPIGAAVAGILGLVDLKSLWNNVIKPDGEMTFKEWLGDESLIGKAIGGLIDLSKFIGGISQKFNSVVGKVITKVTEVIPGIPTIEPPEFNGGTIFDGIGNAVLSGLYLKAGSAIGSAASAIASMISAGSNVVGNLTGGKGGNGLKALGGNGYGHGAWGLAADALGVTLMAKSYLDPSVHDNTDAAGNEIEDETTNRVQRNWGKRAIANRTIQGLASHAGTLATSSTAATARMAEQGITQGVTRTGREYFRNSAGRFVSREAAEQAGMTTAQRIAASNADDVAEAAGRAVLNGADDAATSRGAVGFIKKALTAIKDFLMKSKTFEKVAKTIGTKIDDMLLLIGSKAEKILAKMPAKVSNIITKGGTKEAASVATAGIGYAVMAFGGALSGGLSAANIFGVREKDVDAKMRTIASVIVAMLNAVPGLWALELLDLVLMPLMGTTIRSFLCQLLYNLLGGAEDLEEKQATFGEDLNAYNAEYGAQLSTEEYNDMVNKGMWSKMFGRGSVKTDAEGRAMFDDAGEALRTNHGVAGWFSNGEKEYARDASGNIVRDSSGKAVQAIDASGHKVYKEGEKKWTGYVGDFFHDVGSFFGGKKTYETDENGNVVYDENGKAVVQSKEGNIFQRGGAAISDWWGGKEITNPDGSVTKTEGFKDAATRTLGSIGNTIAKPFKEAGNAIASWWGGEYETDENGDPIVDENGQKVRKGGFKDMAKNTIGKVAGHIGNFTKGITSGIKDWALGEYERDENGNPLLDENNQPIRKGGVAGFIKSGLGKLNETIVQPVKDMASSAGNWIKEKAGWVKDGVASAGAWISEKAGNLWETVSTPVKDAVSSAKGWLKDKANWIGDKAKSVGSWISDKASSIWTTVSTPVKDAAKGVSDWVKDKAGWVKDKAKDAGAWISEKAGDIFTGITDNITKMKDGVKDWVEKKADWVKDGVKNVGDWIADKAKNVWDFFTKPFKDAEERGKQAAEDEAYIQAAQSGGVGNPIFRRIGGIGAPVAQQSIYNDGGGGTSSSSAVSSDGLYGSSPFNGGFRVTSGYGNRPSLGGFHAGVDLVPTSGNNDIYSRFNGTIKAVKNNVSDSDTGHPYNGSNAAGNYVQIETSDGTVIKNFHLKAGSIPSNIQPGARVTAGQKIGQMGSTGHSTGAHLHYQVEKLVNGQYNTINPMDPSQQNSAAGSNTEFERWIRIIEDVKRQIAAHKQGYVYGGNVMAITSDGFTVSYRTDCSGFVSICVSCFAKKKVGVTSKTLVGDGGGIAQLGFVKSGWPGWDALNQGDIIAKDGHTEIFCKNDGGTHYVWNCGSNDSCNNPGPTRSSKPSYTVIWRPKCSGAAINVSLSGANDSYSSYSSNGVDTSSSGTSGGGILSQVLSFLGSLGNKLLYTLTGGLLGENPNGSENGSSDFTYGSSGYDSSGESVATFNAGQYASAANIGPGAEALWKYFKSLGYSDNEVAGVLGCWTAESGNNPKRVEWDYSSTFKNSLDYDTVANDRQKLDSFTQALFNQYARQGLGINQGAYRASDGHLYPGLGYAQWTGPRGKALLDFAKANNIKWYDSSTQLAYLDTELKGSYSNVRSAMQGANSPEEAAGIFCSKFEGYNGSKVAQRKTNARALIDKFGGQYSNVGSPTEGDGTSVSSYGNTNYNSSAASSSPTSIQSAVRNLARNVASSTAKIVNPKGLQQMLDSSSNGGTDLSGVISALNMIVNQLKDISTNTGTSSDLLGSLNEKDFVDKGLRDSLDALKGKGSSSRRTGSHASAKAVAAMAKP